MRVRVISVPHHDWRAGSESAIAIAEEQHHAVAVVSTDSEVQLTIKVYISECNFVRRVRDGRRARWGGKLSVTFAQQNGDAAIFCARHDQVQLFIIVHVAGDYIAGPTRD